jgi:hypothetical protein
MEKEVKIGVRLYRNVTHFLIMFRVINRES